VTQRALALDLGSSSVRAIVFEVAGGGMVAQVEGALARRPRQLELARSGQATFDPDGYFADLVACVDELQERDLLRGVNDVGVDSQWHSVLPLDAAGRPLGEALSWADTRARSYLPPAAPPPGDQRLEALRQRTGCAYAGLYWTRKVPWLLAEGGAGGAARFVGLPDYVYWRLVGDVSTSVSMASGTGLLATATLEWDPEALELAGLTASRLSPIAPPEWLGQLAGEWRKRWPALAEARWHPVLGDGAAANLGAGCERPGRAAITVGTSAAVRAVRPAPDRAELAAGLWRYVVDHDRVVVGAAYSSGGQLYRWALSLWEGAGGAPRPGPSSATTGEAGGVGGAGSSTAFRPAGKPSPVRYDVEMPVPAGSEGVGVLPWHSGTRPPAEEVPADEGVVFGLGLGHTGAHIVSAAVEAVCFELAGGLADLEGGMPGDEGTAGPIAKPLAEVVAGGGAFEGSRWWRQRLASALCRPVLFASDPETSARGAAAAALVASADVTQGELVEPVPEEVAALAEARRRWRRWRDALLPLASGHA
jgi:gluconokinase